MKRMWVFTAALVLVLAACARSYDGSSAPDSRSSTSEPARAHGTPSGLDAGAFGDLGVICQPGSPDPITDVTGIDGSTISLGTLSDVGFAPAPGLNKEFNDIAEAFTSWCNEHGGVHGYRLKADLLDARVTEYQNRVVEACDRDFALVGGGAALDSAQRPRLDCGLPQFPAFVVSDEAVYADLNASALPGGGGLWSSADFRYLDERFPDTTDAVATFYGNFATTRHIDERNEQVMKSLGWNIVYRGEYNVLGETNWTPFAQAMKDAGAKGVIVVGEPANTAKFLRAAQAIDYKPEWIRVEVNTYDTNYLKVGGDAVENTFIRSSFFPFEHASENPATQQYLDLIARYEPGGKIAVLGAQGLSAWLLFVQSLNTCIDTGEVTRDCVYATARKVTRWTGGGLHVPTDPRSGDVPDCFTEIQVKHGRFTLAKLHANEGRIYNCDRRNVFKLVNSGSPADGKCPSGKIDPLPSTCAG